MRFSIVVAVPVAVAAAVLAVANRQEVVFRLDPFAGADSDLAFAMPLFLLVFVSFVLGVLVGGTTVALRRRRSTRRKAIAATGIANATALDAGKKNADSQRS